MKVFLNGIIIWICGLSKVVVLPQQGWAKCNPLRDWKEQETEEQGIHSLYSCLTVWARTSHLTSSALGLGFIPSPSLVLRPLDSDWVTSPKFSWVSSLQQIAELLSLLNHITIIFIIHRSLSPPFLSLSLLLWFCLSPL